MLLLGAALLGAAASGSFGAKSGGTFRVSLRAEDFGYIDPALAPSAGSDPVLGVACGRLLGFPDKPPPAGERLVPDLATGFPRISRNGRTYAFTVRKDARFSTGARVTAAAFAREINRVLNRSMQSPGADAVASIVGAADIMAGKADEASGIRARGNTLTLRLTEPVPDLPARLSTTFFCAVPPSLPVDPEGVGGPLPSAAPYYASKYVPGRGVELKRNRFYRGRRAHHVSAFAVELGDDPPTILTRIERGEVDWGFVPNPIIGPRAGELAAKYGVNKAQFFVKPGASFLRLFVLNSSRPLFHNNPQLRRAMNFAIDRKALLAAKGGKFTGSESDQYLIPGVPGFRDAHIYPLKRPNLRRARALAKGHLRDRKAALYVLDNPVAVAQAQIVLADLAKIGVRVSIKILPRSAYFPAVANPREPVDIAWYGYTASDNLDPYNMINAVLDPRSPFGVPAHFGVPAYLRLMAKAARLTGAARYRAYGKLDVELARKQAPLLPYSYDNQLVLVSKRVGCIVFNPNLDLGAVCLK